MRLQLRTLVAAVAVVFASFSSTRAVDITFPLNQIAFNNSTSSLTSGGYTLLFTSTSGTLMGVPGSGNYGGLAVDRYQSFRIQKTAGPTDLIFKSYTLENVSNNSGNTLSFNLTGGTGTSNGNTFTANSTLNYNGSYSLVGSQTVTYSLVNFGTDGMSNDNVFFNALTFTAVPEPSTYALGAIATGVMAAVARRRKTRRA